MGISKQMLFEQMEKDRIYDEVCLLDDWYYYDGNGEWRYAHSTDATVCVECGESVMPKTLCYVHTTARVACHRACVEDREALEYAMGKND